MLFNSIDYLIFFPVVTLVYFCLPRKVRYLWLLAASYFFYGCWNAAYALLMLTSTMITYASGLFLDALDRRQRPGLRKLCVAASFASNLLILAYFKYGNFLLDSAGSVLTLLGARAALPRLNVLLPVGISFYTFQALSYTMDVYRRELPAERNPLRYALFVSFFPQLVAGPIERSKNLLTQIQNPPPFDLQKARRGLLLIAWGLFLKVLIADNLAPVVSGVYGQYAQHSGAELILATVLFSFQIYCDFAGYSQIARGSAGVMGYTLMENFESPYFALSIADFWRRWHISLTTWFRDYLYFPLGGSRRGTFRKHLNTMIVFLVSGLWHGANWTFVIWGLLNGLLMVFGEMTGPLRGRAAARMGLAEASFGRRLFQRLITFALVNVCWVFFRAPDLASAVGILARVGSDFQPWQLFDPALPGLLGVTQTAVVLLAAIALLLAVDGRKYAGVDVAGRILRQGWPLRWLVYLGLVLAILLFGAYGSFFTQTQFLYFQF